jgi:hypothetical protein
LNPKPCCRVDQVKIPSAISRVEEKINFEITPKKKKREEVWILFSISRAEENRNFEIAPKTNPKKRGKKRSERSDSLLTYLQ